MLLFIGILYLILLAATPFVALYLLGKYKKLRAEFDQNKEEYARQTKSLQREIAELKKQITSTGPAFAAAAEKPAERPTPPGAVTTREVPVPPSRVEFPPPVLVPPPAAVPPQEPVIGPTPPVTSVTTGLPAPVQVPPPRPLSPRLPAAHLEGEMPSTLAARISTPLPVSAFKVAPRRDSTPRPTLQQRMKAVSSIEETLGTNWLLKIGVTLFVIGMAYWESRNFAR